MKNPLLAVAACCVLLAVSRAFAGPIDVPMQDSRAAGEADAFTAQADDPSAIFYNPAGLTQLNGTQISAGAFFLQPEFHFKGDDGSNERMNLPTVLPHLYVESDFGLERWRFGLGVNGQYGINEDWGNKGPLRTVVNKAQLSVINFSPAVAYKADDHLSIGAAFNVYYGDLLLKRNVVLAAPPVPQGQFRLSGDGFSFGVTPSLLYKIDDRNQVGVYYRSPFSISFDGNARITSSVIPEIGPSSTKSSLNFPQSAGFGYMFRPIKPLRVEADVVWTDWSTVHGLEISSPDAHFNGQSLPAAWKSGFDFRLGAEYQVTQHWAVRAGYAYGQNAAPQDTFSPIAPDSNYHLGAVGVGYSTSRWSLDLAAEIIYREQRHIENNVNSPLTDGTWHNTFYGLMLTYTLKL